MTSHPMPAIFFGHGNPLNALLRNAYSEGWATIGNSIPRPKAVLCVSAHWYFTGTAVTAMPAPRTIHDFGGFPRELYQVEYPAPGSPALARQVKNLLAPVSVELDEKWGLDHGTWSMLCHVFPEADIPVAMPGLAAPARRVGLLMFDTMAASFTGSGGTLLDAAVGWAIGGGSITGSVATSPVGTINQTSEGLIDWAHWGAAGPTSFDHKAGVALPISNFTKIGAGALNWFVDCPTTFSWTDGTPTLTATTATGINTNGAVGNGLEITIPAEANTKTLKLYVGVWYAQGKLEATISDGSAPAFIDSSLNNNGGVSFGVYTINYKAGSPGQTLKVRYTILNQYFSPNGTVALESATLR